MKQAKKKVISISLYGCDPKYLYGAIQNVHLGKHFYPEWTLRFYVGQSVPDETVATLRALGAEIVCKAGREDASAMFWRFEPFFDPDVSIVMVRDADSRFSQREIVAVREWLDSGAGFHIMRDHPEHYCAILGGLWGGRVDRMQQFKEIFSQADPVGAYGADQKFLQEHVYSIAKSDAVIHDSFFAFERSARRFPTPRNGSEFLGEVFDDKDQPRMKDRETLERIESSLYRRLRLKWRSIKQGLDGLYDFLP